MHTSDAEDLIAAGGPVVGEPFGPLEHETFRWTGDVHRGLARRARRIAQLHHHRDPERRNEILAAVRSLGERVADADGRIAMPYVTHAYRVSR